MCTIVVSPMTELSRNIACNWLWEEMHNGVCFARSFFTPAFSTSSQSECAEGFEPSLAGTCVALCPEGATAQPDSSCDCAPGLFQVWYVKAISIHVSRLAQSIEVTAYSSSGQQVEQFIGSGEVYMDFGTRKEHKCRPQ